MWLSWVHLWLFWAPDGGPLGSQMVDLRCQDTDWVGGNDAEDLDAILLPDSLIFSMDKGKCGFLECISGCFGALREARRVRDDGFRV